MFSRLFRKEPAQPAGPPPFDTNPALDDHALRDAMARVDTGDWTAARDVVAAAGNNWELRGRRRTLLAGRATENESWLYAWLRAAPDDPDAVLMQALLLNMRAGEARGSAPAAQTSREQFQAFAALSDAAAQVSRRAIALAGPDDPGPWIELLDSMFADGRGDSQEFAETLAEARRRDPFNFDLNVTLVSIYCQKWYGSHEQMFSVARQVSAAAPPGATAVMMPFLAHFEYAMREFSWNKATAQSLADVAMYFQRPEVQAELDACTAKWRAGAHTHGPGRPMTMRNWLALYYFLSNRPAEGRAVFAEIGPYMGGTFAWEYFLGPAENGFTLAWRFCHKASPA
ncbi:hypothetical protein AB0M02_26370 [Actinoplanes sp. NPDC051861]|uniref:hypothetical protein n=1 Tax=Actinoplanes sp. NPDC051861 TaxID=3155170 RepID=UPI00342F3F02